MGKTSFLDDEDREDDRRESARPEPAEEADRRPPRSRTEHRDRDREHAHYREAQDGVEDDRPSHLIQRRLEQYGAEDDERDRAQDSSSLLDQVADLALLSAPQAAEDETADEGGDEAGAAERLRDSEHKPGAGEQHDL